MAIYGFDVKTISRMRGMSVTKTASYILRKNIYDSYLDEIKYNYSKNDLVYSEVLVPDYAPRRLHDLSTLLSEIDLAEKRYDARTGRAVRLTLPNDKEISDEDRIELTRNYVKDEFVSKGMCAVIAIHEGRNEDPAKNNPHAHVLITDRPVDENGFCTKKNRDWNKKTQLNLWRKAWAEAQNKLFREKEMEIRLSHESLKVQGIDREPTRPLGRAATALERNGIKTEIGNRNREIIEKEQQKEAELKHRREYYRQYEYSR